MLALSDLLVALKDNEKVFVTLIDTIDEVETEMITFNCGGYESVESDLGEREVASVTVDSLSTLKVKLVPTP